VKISRVDAWREAVRLSRPYEISSTRIEAVDLLFVRLSTDQGIEGIGSASPAEDVTGESPSVCEQALSRARLEWLEGRDPRELDTLLGNLERSHRETPAARAALDMALHDLVARSTGVPLVDLFGRHHDVLPTSVTIGISSVEESLADAEEFVGQGFCHLKVKTGRSLTEDRERLAKLREKLGTAIMIRIDANQGYTTEETLACGEMARELGIELIEQPLAGRSIDELRVLPDALRRIVAADESLLDEEDARALAATPAACGIFNIKLMKCGGIRPAFAIAEIGRDADIDLMWGCNDESVISIAAALHAAFAFPHTRYLDLDGSFDLARDPAAGGFVVEGGCLRLLDRPGLGVDLVS
jgi:L-alanine-DL-glutamate epimerase-like enolase superfamily enzyme